MNTKRWPGNGKSHSAVAMRRVVGERLPSSSSQVEITRSYANTLEPASPDTVAAVTTQGPIATVIVDVPQIVSLLCLPSLQTAELSSWKVATEGLVVDAMSIMQKAKADISAMTVNAHALPKVKNAILSFAFHVMLGQWPW